MKTNTKFKIGDKVYVHCGDFPGDPDTLHIRATITGIDTHFNGYLLRAFQQDLPGIYMFNVHDDQLSVRADKSKYELR